MGIVGDIAKEGKIGHYDAVVLGRRGYLVFECFLQDSVTREILDRKIDFPIWVCRQFEENRKNVLLCVDGSKQSLHIADHVGFVLKDEEEHTVTILHIMFLMHETVIEMETQTHE